ncbi:acyl-CoA dehydrogenase family protein [Allokutzneria oryzae]|uniref:Acyl-CoA dehydrogenase n=1 Tax=Allokutzneria oryzae TaxID=1378989 RepID=A0ABV6A6I2_9PSEU
MGVEEQTRHALAGLVHGDCEPEFREELRELLRHELFAPREGLTYQEELRLTYERMRFANDLVRPEELVEHPLRLFALLEWSAVVSPSLFIGMVTHYCGALAAIRELGAGREDLAEYISALEQMSTTGALLITELGYGNSHVAMRTRATYDPDRQDFVLHTPDPAARKFMPNVGLPGVPKLATVAAQLDIGGEDRGVFLFVVQLRDADGLLSGVTITQLPEATQVPMDYAVISFDHVRVPMRSLLRDSASFTDNGFHDPIDDPVQRLTRSLTVAQSVRTAQTAALASVARASAQIALRYSLRRQTMEHHSPWVPVIRYRSQQRALYGALATAYALTCHANRAKAAKANAMIHNSTNRPVPPSALDPLPRTLSLTKAVTVWATERLTAECRQRCGARGVFAVNRLLDYQGLAIVSNAAGGDNLMLCLDAAKSMVGGVHYTPPTGEPAGQDLLDRDLWLGLAHARERELHRVLKDRIWKATAKDSRAFQVWNDHLTEAAELVTAHGSRLITESLLEAVSTVEDPDAAAALEPLCGIHALNEINDAAAWYLCEGLLTAEQVRSIPLRLNGLCEQVTPHLSLLLDAFELPEDVLRVPITDGDLSMVEGRVDVPHQRAETGVRTSVRAR